MTDRTEQRVSSFELFLQGELKPVGQGSIPLRAGSRCPQCGRGRLAYNGMLALECPECGYTHGDGGGCT